MNESNSKPKNERRYDPELLKKGLRCDLDQYEMLKRCSKKKILPSGTSGDIAIPKMTSCWRALICQASILEVPRLIRGSLLISAAKYASTLLNIAGVSGDFRLRSVRCVGDTFCSIVYGRRAGRKICR